jgi:hypothetical protein
VRCRRRLEDKEPHTETFTPQQRKSKTKQKTENDKKAIEWGNYRRRSNLSVRPSRGDGVSQSLRVASLLLGAGGVNLRGVGAMKGLLRRQRRTVRGTQPLPPRLKKKGKANATGRVTDASKLIKSTRRAAIPQHGSQQTRCCRWSPWP